MRGKRPPKGAFIETVSKKNLQSMSQWSAGIFSIGQDPG